MGATSAAGATKTRLRHTVQLKLANWLLERHVRLAQDDTCSVFGAGFPAGAVGREDGPVQQADSLSVQVIRMLAAEAQ